MDATEFMKKKEAFYDNVLDPCCKQFKLEVENLGYNCSFIETTNPIGSSTKFKIYNPTANRLTLSDFDIYNTYMCYCGILVKGLNELFAIIFSPSKEKENPYLQLYYSKHKTDHSPHYTLLFSDNFLKIDIDLKEEQWSDSKETLLELFLEKFTKHKNPEWKIDEDSIYKPYDNSNGSSFI